jgi:hypothetical protein
LGRVKGNVRQSDYVRKVNIHGMSAWGLQINAQLPLTTQEQALFAPKTFDKNEALTILRLHK